MYLQPDRHHKGHCRSLVAMRQPRESNPTPASLKVTEQCPSPVIQNADHPRYILSLIGLATQWFPGLTMVIGIVLAIVESSLVMPWLLFGTMTTVVATFLIVASRVLPVQKMVT